jgi:hypothetical protein
MHLPSLPETSPNTTASVSHLIVVIGVLISASILRAIHDIDSATISTVYGAALGYASGLIARSKNG